MWWLATSLLLFMSLLFLLSTKFQTLFPWLAPVQAFAEAAMVGALADWFAVTALFRHPLGLPIPHTAIVPNNKNRIGKSLGGFVQSNFLSDEVLQGQAINIAGAVTKWLDNPDNRRSVVRRVRLLVPRLLETIEENEIRRFADMQVEEFVRRMDIARVAARGMRLFTANGMHEVLLDEVVKQSRAFFHSNEDWFRTQMREASPWFVPEFVDKKIFDAILNKTEETLSQALSDRNHELRLRVHGAVEQFIEKLETSQEFQQRGEELKELLLSNPVFRGYVNSVREGILATIKSDIERDDSQLAETVERMLEGFVTTMSSSEEIQAKLNAFIRRVIKIALGDQSGHVSELIARTIDSWDSTTLVRKLEEQVGQDLQYIRINGTLVGGLVGLCLFLLERAVHAF
jgi:uncharacterized membrane-anchored protein YjiN (DUF445 family)